MATPNNLTNDGRQQLHCNGKTLERIHAELSAPFADFEIDWRVGNAWPKDKPEKANMLCYLTAPSVIRRLDQVVGPGNWQFKLERLDAAGKGDSGFIGSLGIRIYGLFNMGVSPPGGEWIWKSDVAGESNMEGLKGGSSGAMKRAARLWGVGLYLYELPRTVAPVERFNNTTVVAKGWRPPSQEWLVKQVQAGIPRMPEIEPEHPADEPVHFNESSPLPTNKEEVAHPDQDFKAPAASHAKRAQAAPKQQARPKVEYTEQEPLWLDDRLGGNKWPDKTWRWFLEKSESGERYKYLEYHADFERRSKYRNRACIMLMQLHMSRWITDANLAQIDILSELKAIRP